MYNRLYDYLVQNNILYNKQFGFQNGHSTDHAVIQLVDDILKSFDQNLFTLGVFIDESSHRDLLAKYLFKRGYLPGKCLCVRGIGVSWKIVCVRGIDRASWKMSICSMRK